MTKLEKIRHNKNLLKFEIESKIKINNLMLKTRDKTGLEFLNLCKQDDSSLKVIYGLRTEIYNLTKV